METLSSEFPLAKLARTLGVSRAAHYRAPDSGPRAVEDAWLTLQIRRIFIQHKKRYGSPRIHTQLRQQGILCGKNRVARLMQEAGLVAKTPKRKAPRTTDSRHGGPIAPNLLKDMKINRPNQAWAMDITYIPQSNSWAYLAAVLDLHLHKVVGWDISESLHADVVCAALQNAQRRQGYPDGVVVHSDRGSQYASESFVRLCGHFGCVRSMSAKGNCYDNATMESFFGVLKREELNDFQFDSVASVRAQVFEYIETYYNRVRIHTALGMSPQAFESLQKKTPSAEFSQAWVAPMVGEKMAGEKPPRPRPTVATPDYPSEGCSPAEPSSVSPDTPSIHQESLVFKH
jgi:transposase InsO family protein